MQTLKLKLKRTRISTRISRTPETIQRNKKGDASASPFLCFCLCCAASPNGVVSDEHNHPVATKKA
jgi:hypothetical protein